MACKDAADGLKKTGSMDSGLSAWLVGEGLGHNAVAKFLEVSQVRKVITSARKTKAHEAGARTRTRLKEERKAGQTSFPPNSRNTGSYPLGNLGLSIALPVSYLFCKSSLSHTCVRVPLYIPTTYSYGLSFVEQE